MGVNVQDRTGDSYRLAEKKVSNKTLICTQLIFFFLISPPACSVHLHHGGLSEIRVFDWLTRGISLQFSGIT